MARGNNTTKKNTTKKNTQKVEEWFANSENAVMVAGVVKRIVVESDKVLKFSLDTVTPTPNGNYSHAFITCCTFNENVEVTEGDFVIISGRLNTTSYNGKYSTEVLFDELSTED